MPADERHDVLRNRTYDVNDMFGDDRDPTTYFVVETAEDLDKLLAAIMAQAPADEDRP